MKIIGHMIVKNEERFVWYSINSVLPFLDKLIVYDTGSTDRTMDLIKSIQSPKIALKEVGSVNDMSHTEIRNQMIKLSPASKYDWIMIVDGDEIWPQQQLSKTIEKIKATKANIVVVHTKNVVGDLYHVLPESAGQYTILGKKGHLAMRFLRTNIPKLRVVNPHGGQTYLINDLPVLEQDEDKIMMLPYYYIHTTHLRRSSKDRDTLKRSFKYKYELGLELPKEKLPKIFFVDRPPTIPEVTGKMDPITYAFCALMTIPRRLRRRFVKLKSGYI